MEFLRIVWEFLNLTVGDWIATKRMRRRLREGLGHDVEDFEVTSIKRWMEMPADRRPPYDSSE